MFLLRLERVFLLRTQCSGHPCFDSWHSITNNSLLTWYTKYSDGRNIVDAIYEQHTDPYSFRDWSVQSAAETPKTIILPCSSFVTMHVVPFILFVSNAFFVSSHMHVSRKP